LLCTQQIYQPPSHQRFHRQRQPEVFASAYDSAEHVLQTFALGMTFIRNIKTAYRNAQRLVKIQSTAQAHCSHSPFLLIILGDYGLPEQELFAAHMRKTTVFIINEGFTRYKPSRLMVHVNWTFRTPMEKQDGPPGKLSMEWTRRELSR
jgi:hypothetical protein